MAEAGSDRAGCLVMALVRTMSAPPETMGLGVKDVVGRKERVGRTVGRRGARDVNVLLSS